MLPDCRERVANFLLALGKDLAEVEEGKFRIYLSDWKITDPELPVFWGKIDFFRIQLPLKK
jgi:hypothetical protein